ncbi:MAG: ribokinase [Oscillospiraceae bacterium]
MAKKILVAGSSNIDFVLNVKKMPQKGETITSKAFNKIPGGKGANQACACGMLGGQCTFLSAVGTEGLGDIIVESLNKANVNTKQIEFTENEPTGMAIISVDDCGENEIILVPGANSICNYAYFMKNEDCINEADIVISQLETPPNDVYELLNFAKKANKLTILNPAPAPDYLPEDVLQGLDYITPNETELQRLTGMPTQTIDQISKAARTLLSKGVKNVLVTIGPRGALLCSDKIEKQFLPYDVKPVDTTAAGDVFNAAIAVALAEERNIEDAIMFANAASSIAITRKGAQTSIPTRSQTEQFITANTIMEG